MLSTSNVADSDVINYLVDAEYATYVMDRGYGYKTKIGGWLERSVDFLGRVRHNFRYEVLRSRPPTLENVKRFDIVSILTRPERHKLLEFTDEEGTRYLLLTNRLDLNEEEILEMYKSRRDIEIFFRWLKQHIKLDHLYSHSPKGIWNQLFIALITVGLAEIMRVIKKIKETPWNFYRLIRLYLMGPWEKIQKELDRVRKPSKGRQKARDRPKKELDYNEDFAIVSPISKEHFVKK